jgi:hypothetical protein
MRRIVAPALCSALVGALLLALPATAHAEEPAATPPRASWHPKYVAELELHGEFAIADYYGPGGGMGLRATLPIFENQPLKRVDDTISLSIGLDWVRYGSYHPTGAGSTNVTTDAFYVPLSVPFDVWLGRVALFVEPAVVWRFARYDGCGRLACDESSRFFPTGFVGMRVKTAERVSITFRAGWPMFTLGASWL